MKMVKKTILAFAGLACAVVVVAGTAVEASADLVEPALLEAPSLDDGVEHGVEDGARTTGVVITDCRWRHNVEGGVGATVECASGEALTAGGCWTSRDFLLQNSPNFADGPDDLEDLESTDDEWGCESGGGRPGDTTRAMALCCKAS